MLILELKKISYLDYCSYFEFELFIYDLTSKLKQLYKIKLVICYLMDRIKKL